MPDRKISRAPQDPTPQPFGPFVLERRIAIGGTAEVFHARPRSGQRPASQLVIKRLLVDKTGEDHFSLLSREAELNRAVQHENVVTVFGAGMVGNEPYLAMEFVDGVDLHRLLRLSASENKPLPPSLSVYIARCIARALSAVHRACGEQGEHLRITHGDVSPSNIYLSLSGEVKLGDFGVAHTTRPADKSASVRGKFGYLAPEQLEGDAFDQRADIFALGVVLGEMLIGQKIFPGSGQLATLLSIREANIEPLRRAADAMPRAVFEACTRALERNPDDRFSDADEMARSLEPLCDPLRDRALLVEWVAWARDANVFARQLSQRLRHASGAGWDTADRSGAGRVHVDEKSSVRRGSALLHQDVSFPELVELAATGHLQLDDEVSLLGAEFRRVADISELSRYLMPSTTTTTAQLFEPGVPDYTAELSEVRMLEVLARLRQRRESGALFVTRRNRRGIPDRKDIYLKSGRLLHVASSDREELLGQYALRLKLITQDQLDEALLSLQAFGGRLGDTLIGLGIAEPTAIFRAIRNQGRDRVASLCSWKEGRVQLYRGSEAGQIQFPLDLDLTVPMMAGAMILLRHGDDPLARVERLYPGRRFEEAQNQQDIADAPATLIELAKLVHPGLTVASLVTSITAVRAQGRSIPPLEARAAVVVASCLEWIRTE